MLNIYPVCKMDSFLFDADPDDGDWGGAWNLSFIPYQLLEKTLFCLIGMKLYVLYFLFIFVMLVWL
jgi:hypothetical protein